MKKFFVSVLFILFLMGYTNAASNAKGIMSVKGVTLAIDFKEEVEPVIDVCIKDMSGVILYKESVNTHMTKQKVYNLKNLPEGKYVIERQKEMTKVSQFFSIKEGQVQLLEEKVLYKPVTMFEDNIWSLNLLCMDETTSMHIRERGGEEIYSEKFETPSSISKRYSLEKLPSGIYVIDVFVGDEIFKETVVVR